MTHSSAATKLILQAPPGELLEVVASTRSLLGDAAVDAVVAAAAREHNLAHLVCLELPGGGKVLLCSAAELDSSGALFLEPRTAQAVTVDHARQVVAAVRPATAAETGAPEAEPHRRALESALVTYVSASYAQHGTAAVFATGTGAALSLTICLSSASASLKNFWAGAAHSRWEVSTTPGGAALRGHLASTVHYFEDGNVQLATSHCATATAPCDCADPPAFAEAVVAALRATESDYFGGLEATFDALAERSLKELRRALPVTRARFPWENTAAKLAGELRAKEAAL